MSAPELNLNRLIYFSAVVDCGSFTQAAARLGVAKTSVSQQVARLEAELGVGLLARTTRRVQPTEAGRQLYARSAVILNEAQEAVAELSVAGGAPAGVLRITAPNDFGTFVLAPLAAAFCTQYPDVSVELLLSDTRLDMLENDIDLAVRVGWLEDSSHQARRIGSFRQLAVATPAVAATLAGDRPADLAALAFIANGALKDPLRWTVTHTATGEVQAIEVVARLTVTTTPAALAAVLAHGGFSILPDFLIDAQLADGSLVQVLPDWTLPTGGVHILYPAARHRPPKTTVFAARLADQARANCRNR